MAIIMVLNRFIPRRLIWPLMLLVALAVLEGGGTADASREKRGREASRDLRFAAEMAEQELWREALFRWERVLAADPHDAHLLNNVAVAKEALGDVEGAAAAYARAVAANPDPKIVANQTLFQRNLDMREEKDEGEELTE